MQKEGKKTIAIATIVIMVLAMGFSMMSCRTTVSFSKEDKEVKEALSEVDKIAQELEKENSQESGRPPSIPDEQGGGDSQQGEAAARGLATYYYFVFGAEALILMLAIMYLVVTKGCKITLKESFKNKGKTVLWIVIVIVGTGVLTTGCSYITASYIISDNHKMDKMESQSQEASVEATGVVTVDGTKETVKSPGESTSDDQNVVTVKNGGVADISGTITKTSGSCSSTDNSDFYGINSGILAQKESSASIKDAVITTSTQCSNAVFATGEGATIKISDSTIKTTGKRSARGLDATYGGKIEADNVTIETQGESCATLATDRGEGTVSAKNCKLTANGNGSPVIYSTGDISLKKSTGTAKLGQVAVVEGKNLATVKDCTIACGGKGVRNGNIDGAGVFIYQSQSGDASEGTGTFSAEDSTLSVLESSDYYKTVPMFFVTNTDAIINLNNTKLNFGSGVLLSAKGTDQWGKSGKNGGNVVFNAEKQSLTGNIVVDNISTLNMALSSDSTYTGTINGDKAGKEVNLVLDKSSKIKLTGDSYVTSLENADSSNSNIDFNGHKLYVNGKAIN